MTAADQAIRVFLLDDQEIVRRGLRGLLDAEPDIQVVGEAGSAAAALTRMPAVRPDVAVLEMRLPDCDGARACRKIRARMPDTACLVLTERSDDRAPRDAVMAGCAGYILKQARGASLAAAVRAAASGQPALDAHAAGALMAWVQDRARTKEVTARLTAREREVLSLLGEGLSSRQIGERMTVTEATVRNYVGSLLAKLDMRHRTEAAAFAARMTAGHAQPPAWPADGDAGHAPGNSRTRWMSRAACRGIPDAGLFFPAAAGQAKDAKAVCARCPVRAACLSYALATRQFGVWGGATENERLAMSRARKRRARPRPEPR